MKVYNKQGEELLSGACEVRDGKVQAKLTMGGSLSFDMPALEASFEGVSEGLCAHLFIPGSGLEGVDVVIEPDDMKTLKQVPGKGLVGFVLKAMRA